jgi:acetoacetyl-CoA synthetase
MHPRPPFIPLIRLYQQWLGRHKGLHFESYEDFWKWSVQEPEAFWGSLWEHDGLHSPTPFSAVLPEARMPGAVWFPGAEVNYAQRVFSHAAAADAAGQPAVVAENELGEVRVLSWAALQQQVAACALGLRRLGVLRGDRVAAYLPNTPDAVVAFLACASLGAIWSLCAPDMGTQAVADRFRQIEPKVLIAADGVHYAGRALDRAAVVQGLRQALPSVQALVLLRTPFAGTTLRAEADFATLCSGSQEAPAALAGFVPEWLPFAHPLWIVYSSGTTGAPKALVHGHGGVMLMKGSAAVKHGDQGPSYSANNWGERFLWYSSTGWVMWNAQVGGLLGGTTICIYDGSPSGPKDAPDFGVLFRFAARHRVTWFGAGAAFYANALKAGVDLSRCGDLCAIRALGATGSPLAPEVQQGISERFLAATGQTPWWHNISGGTDFCGAFVGGHRELPDQPGRLACRQLGCAVYAYDEQGQAVVGRVGELVCTQPLPSMPLYLWNDADGRRLHDSYFAQYPGVWRHGDWIEIGADGSCVIHGRSDATLNRHGLRLGTSEIYAAVEALPEVLDSMVIDIEAPGLPSRMWLFVVLRAGLELDPALQQRIQRAIAQAVSPRFVPDVLLHAPEVPRTLSGKKQEVPIKRLFLGQGLDKVVNRDAMANPACLDWYAACAAQAQVQAQARAQTQS